jgi:hypothetical protein
MLLPRYWPHPHQQLPAHPMMGRGHPQSHHLCWQLSLLELSARWVIQNDAGVPSYMKLKGHTHPDPAGCQDVDGCGRVSN